MIRGWSTRLEKAREGWERAVKCCKDEHKRRNGRVDREKSLVRGLIEKLDTLKKEQELLVKTVLAVQEELGAGLEQLIPSAGCINWLQFQRRSRNTWHIESSIDLKLSPCQRHVWPKFAGEPWRPCSQIRSLPRPSQQIRKEVCKTFWRRILYKEWRYYHSWKCTVYNHRVSVRHIQLYW